MSPRLYHYRLSLASMYIIIALSATFLNAIVLVAIKKTSSLHKSSYVLLANLAASDLINGLIVSSAMGLGQIAKIEYWSRIYCEFMFCSRLVCYWTTSVSVFTLTLISVDRFLAVALKHRYKTIVTMKRAILSIIPCWLLPLGLSLTLAVNFSGSKFDIFVFASGILLMLLLVIIVINYSMAFYILKKITNTTAPNADSNHVNPTMNIRKYRNTFNTMIIICLVVLLFYLPTAVGFVNMKSQAMVLSKGESYNQHQERIYVFWLASELVVMSNSVINPLLYIWRMKELRTAMIAVVKKL